jgi:hypothetical protein
MMETIAVYWEPRIRTYGVQWVEGLQLFQIAVSPVHMAQWGQALQSLAEDGPAFRLVWAQAEAPDTDRIKFFLLCDHGHGSKVHDYLEGQAERGVADKLQHPLSVDLLFLQGPHYGDRYGVLDFTLGPLVEAEVPLLAVTCSVATLYLITAAGWGARAKTLLSGVFEIPCGAEA